MEVTFMAKTYINTMKYEVTIDFKITGLVDKPDIIGAVFGQSEGLLGEELDLRELQKNGKIGRIEITYKNVGGNSLGKIVIPSSMDMVETCILAAAIETVDKVGPYKSEFKIEEIQDTRTKKREEVKKRASDLLRRLLQDEIPDSGAIAKHVRDVVRKSELVSYGRDKLPAGPEIDESDSIILVEGRADVVNLLKNNIKNCIGLEGGTVPETIIELSKRKTVTLFSDGDRGGELILRKVKQLASLDYVARAPAGKEVEELERKEIVMALRKKLPVSQLGTRETTSSRTSGTRPGFEQRSFKKPTRSFGRDRGFSRTPQRRSFTRTRDEIQTNIEDTPQNLEDTPQKTERVPAKKVEVKAKEEPKKKLSADQEKFKTKLGKLKGTLKAKLFDSKDKELATVNVRDLMKSIDKQDKVHAVVFDGIITKRLADACDKKAVNYLVGIKQGKIGEPKKTKIVVIE